MSRPVRAGRKTATALLISFDGVIWQRDDVATADIEKRSGLAPGRIQAVAFAPVRAVPAMLGQVSRAAWCESVAAGLAEAVGGLEAAEKVVEEWYAVRGEIVPEVMDFIAGVRAAGAPVGISVSGIDDLPPELPPLLDAVVNAVEIGASIPHPDHFGTACRALAVLPRHCLYVGTAPRNVAGARAADLLAYRYSGVESLSYLSGIFTSR